MSNPSITHPPGDADIVALQPTNTTIRNRMEAVLTGLAGHRRLHFLGPVGIDPRPAPIAPDLIAEATHSAQQTPSGQIGPALKRAFLRGQYNWSYRRFPPHPPLVVACWNGMKGHRYLAMAAAKARGHATLYLEHAPLPGRITIDFQGVNAASSLPRRAAFFRAWAALQQGRDLTQWRAMRADLTARAPSHRQDVAQDPGSADLGRVPYVFLPLQVPGDSQITVFGDWITSVEQMLRDVVRASAALPEGWQLRVKEHPSARKSLAPVLAEVATDRVVLDNSTNTMDLVRAASAVVTCNSSVGFESLFFDKPVITLGHAFYNVAGVATKARSAQDLAQIFARANALSFDTPLRDAFMSYVGEVHFPKEADVVSGHTDLDAIIARDRARDQILQNLTD